MRTRRFFIFTLTSAFFLIAFSVSINTIKNENKINLWLSGMEEPQIARVYSEQVRYSTAMDLNSSQSLPFTTNPLLLLKQSAGTGVVNIEVSKKFILKKMENYGKVQFKIMVQGSSNVNVIALGFVNINLPIVTDISSTLNVTGKFNLNPFDSKNLNYKIYGLGNIGIAGNLMAGSVEVSDGLLSRIRGSGKVAAFINPEVDKWLPGPDTLKGLFQ